MLSFTTIFGLGAVLLAAQTSALGINCRGSALCPRATMSTHDRITQVLRDAVYATNLDPKTVFNSGQHIICISQSESISISASAGGSYSGATGTFSLSGSLAIGAGGICLFTQGCSLTLDQIRPLTDRILEHGCSTCGSTPIGFPQSNDPSSGILTYNYVENPYCDGTCISSSGSPTGNPTSTGGTGTSNLVKSAKFVKPKVLDNVINGEHGASNKTA